MSGQAGVETEAVLRFQYAGADISAPSVVISGPAASVLSVDVALMRPAGRGVFEMPILLTLPAGATGALPGSLHVRDGLTQVGPALPVRAVVAPISGIPQVPARPSPDRIG